MITAMTPFSGWKAIEKDNTVDVGVWDLRRTLYRSLVCDPMLLSNENGDKETRKALKFKIKLLCLQRLVQNGHNL